MKRPIFSFWCDRLFGPRSMQHVRQVAAARHGTRHVIFTAAALSMVVLSTPTAFGGAGGKPDAAPRPTRPGAAGTVTTGFGSGRVDEASALVVQRDGKIVVAGSSSRGKAYDVPRDLALVRYTPDGRLDRSFGSGGKVLTRIGPHYYGSAVAVQPDGKIVAGGSTLARYMPDGRLDTSFGTGGTVSTDFGRTFAIQRDGRIVVAGITPQDGSSPGRFALARYTPDGRLDSSFGTNGKAPTADFGTESAYTHAVDIAEAVTIQRDGRIVAAGGASLCGACNQAQFALARYGPDGRLDTNFGTNGTMHNFSEPYAQASAVAIQANGKIVGAGWWGDGEGTALARYGRNGRLDPSFGVGGQVRGDSLSAQALAAAIQGDGKIVAAGSRYGRGGSTEFALARYTPEGRSDRSFGTRGDSLTSFASRGL
jgi:uncharacterized delta-60 repeat protein